VPILLEAHFAPLSEAKRFQLQKEKQYVMTKEMKTARQKPGRKTKFLPQND